MKATANLSAKLKIIGQTRKISLYKELMLKKNLSTDRRASEGKDCGQTGGKRRNFRRCRR
jgi:hypothetical protein